MKISLMLFSNRPEKMERFLKSLELLESIRHKFTVTALLQEPYTGREHFLKKIDKIDFHPAVKPPVPFLKLMKRAMEITRDADYFWSLGDDHQFFNPNNNLKFNKTAAEYYEECFNFLENNPKTGILSCKGYLGGYASGYNFVKNPSNGLISTADGGIFYKNVGIENIIDTYEEGLVGALAESLCAYNILDLGYDMVRRFNSSTKHERPNKKEKHIGGATNLSYSDKIVNTNIQYRIRFKFDDPEWTHSSRKYPKKIAIKLGHY